ncbi:leucine-rich repeat domain-containing protein [Microcoleus sp. LAD1_D3]|uniref:leucine-rich repeat domain-containing protein n=1 Tax=Microcoleus sp. LAD1_D3 TaxID=2819365 RepID=UPI002FD44C01
MTFIVAQKHMKLPKSIALSCCVLLALSGNGVSGKAAAEVRSGNSRRTFADWCRQKADLSPEAKHTVEVLLKKAETTECDVADRKLSSLTELNLKNYGISDIKPLESFTNLTLLILSNNKISDIKPLESLTNLTLLGLSNNKISDIKPLEFLTNLISLALDGNHLSDIKPFASLTNLTRIRLSGNPIAPKTCPLKPESICKWEPQAQP